jgi:hypothetical protein
MTIDIHAHYAGGANRASAPAKLRQRYRRRARRRDFRMASGDRFSQACGGRWQRITAHGEKIDYQPVVTWPDIYGYGLSDEKRRQHRLLNHTLAGLGAAIIRRFGFTVGAFAQCRKRRG